MIEILDDFLPHNMAEAAASAFPSPESRDWKRYESRGGRKLEMADYDRMPEALQALVRHVNWPRPLLGYEDLIADHALLGGGLNMSLAGDYLAQHVDFNWNDTLKAYRTVNLIVYLNRDWRDAWGGVLEVDGQRITPSFNRAVVFSPNVPHGFDAVRGPLPRKSVNFYFYRKEPAPGIAPEPHKTKWLIPA